MKRIVITGATSMMGIALIKRCIAHGTQVYAVIRPNSSNRSRLPQSSLVQVIECDLSKICELSMLIGDRGFDCFYHMAWEGTARQQRTDVFIHERNICYALDAARAANDLQCKSFVGAGSQAEYGRVSDMIGPDTPVNPEYAYGIAKLAAGRLCEQYCRQMGMRFVWGRIFSVYGEYDHEDTLVMYLIRSLLNSESPDLTKCEQQWDYLYCADAAEAFYLLGRRGHGVYCIGSGKMYPLLEYVNIIRETIGSDLQIGIGKKPYEKGQVMRLCADIQQLQEDTGFQALIEFSAGIRNTVEWYKREMGE